MATVYLAQDLKHGRPVALKVLRQHLADVVGDGRERFLQEIRVNARLDHPHILTLIDSGEAAGFLYYVMPYVAGESVRTRLHREGALAPADAVRIAVQVAHALDHAHRQGIVHRDIKPENVLLHEGEAMVADFGLALAVGDAGRRRLTEVGLALGTPVYMSPEQSRGERDLDARSDIYALGAVLYEMLTGEFVHTLETTQILLRASPAPEPKHARVIRAAVPGPLAEAVVRALERLPADRFESAAEFAQALERASAAPAPTAVPHRDATGSAMPQGSEDATAPLPSANRSTSGTCVSCGTAIPEGASFCPRCGLAALTTPLPRDDPSPRPAAAGAATPASLLCAHCRTPLPEGSRYCLSCGADISSPSGARAAGDTVADIRRRLSASLEGRYRIKELLGRGGMGTVFLAEDLKLERDVAIKVLPPGLAEDEKWISRFLREARTAARLDHPNIIPIFAADSENGLPYFAMKYVAGRTLDRVLADGPLPVDTCQRLLFEAAAALGHAHRYGVIHRDVKPSNIMVDDAGRVLLADFGISKALEGSSQLTTTGQVMGTPHYMSPEQAKGLTVDGRSDQYSLAVVGFQALTGQRLFQADTPHSAIYMHIHEPARSVRELRPEVPEFLAQALLKALAKEPGQRFNTVEEFASAVWPEHATATTTPLPRASRWGRRLRPLRRRGLAIGAVITVAAALAVVFWPRTGTVPEAPNATVIAPETTLGAGGPPSQSGAASPAPAVPRPRANEPAPPVRQAAPERAAAPVRDTARPAPAATPSVVTAVPVTVNSTNADGVDTYGRLSIDDVDIRDTPVFQHPVTPGRHVFCVAREGYRTACDTALIRAGNPRQIRLILIPQQP
jgi:serine/threonine protein kinase